jgi:hypothetical protein
MNWKPIRLDRHRIGMVSMIRADASCSELS